jgi:hypothetical protein
MAEDGRNDSIHLVEDRSGKGEHLEATPLLHGKGKLCRPQLFDSCLMIGTSRTQQAGTVACRE